MKRLILLLLLVLTSSASAYWIDLYDDFNYNNVGTVPDTIKLTLKYNNQTVINDSSITPAIKWRFVRGVDSAGAYDAVIHYAYNAGGINKNVTKMFLTTAVADSDAVYRQMARTTITATINLAEIDSVMEARLGATTITTDLDWATLKDSIMYWVWAYDGAGDYVPEASRTIGNPGGSTSRSYDVTILLRDSTNSYAGAPYVPVEIQTEAGTVLISDRASDVNGYVYTSLDTGYYYVYPRTTAYIFPASNYAIHVTAAGNHNINCASKTNAPTPSSPSLCRVYGYLLDQSNVAVVGARVSLTLVDCSDTLNYGGSEYACNIEKTATTNSAGYWYIDVIPNATLDANSSYLYRYYKKGTLTVEKEKKVTVPSATSADITTLF